MSEVRRKLEMRLPSAVFDLMKAFQAHGKTLYVVGGAVRDAVMGKEPKDIDLATDALPEEVTKIVTSIVTSKWESDLTGQAFGVIRARTQRLMEEAAKRINELCEFEIATFREDLSMGRHPEVRFATIKEDVQRRDLTINALFYDISKQEIVDLVGGLDDIAEGVIRTVGRPEDRFAEDRLRVLRAIRFAGRFDFQLNVETYDAIARDNNLDGISWERIRDEVVRGIQTARNPRRFMQLMNSFDMWKRVLPGLDAHAPDDSQVSTRGICTHSMPVALAMLLDNEPHLTLLARRLNYLKYTADEIAQVSFLLHFRDLETTNAFKMRKAFQQSKLSREDLAEYFIARGLPNRELMSAFSSYLDYPAVKGDDLLAQGYSGRALGMELEQLETRIFRRLLA